MSGDIFFFVPNEVYWVDSVRDTTESDCGSCEIGRPTIEPLVKGFGWNALMQCTYPPWYIRTMEFYHVYEQK